MRMTFGTFEIDADVQKTRQFYAAAQTVTETCGCAGCRNFEQAAASLPAPVRSFLAALGVDLRKVCECYVNTADTDGMLLYGGFCHICGTLLRGESAWQRQSDTEAIWSEDAAFPVTGTFRVSFQNEICLPEPDFPAPVIQLEFSARIPWVLPGENPWLQSQTP